jgi:alkylation response protein AidB-like acyl-CoA dehydrogenase
VSVDHADLRAEVRRLLDLQWDPEVFADEVSATSLAAGPPVGRWHRLLHEHGLVVPHWPEAWGGRGLGIDARAAVLDELDRRGALGPGNPIGIGWAGSTILWFGTPEQQARYLPAIPAGEEVWCQLFSEPDAGSDLAGLRTTATARSGGFVVSGSKLWNSLAHRADRGILLARTGRAGPAGITYLLVDMRAPGVSVRPIRQMTGEAEFCEVALDDVWVPDGDVVGEVDGGWSVALGTLLFERVDLSTGRGLLWGGGPSFRRFLELVSGRGLGSSRDRVARLYVEHVVLELLRSRALRAATEGRAPITETAVMKLLADEFGAKVAREAIALLGAGGMLADPPGAEAWAGAFLFSPALTVGGGTTEVQKSILGERSLGLPREPRMASQGGSPAS